VTPRIPPYGGRLVDLRASEAEARDLRARAGSLPSAVLSERTACDLELLATGGFSPLQTFLGRRDYLSVLATSRLADGTLWPIPVTLAVPPACGAEEGVDLALRTATGELLAVLEVREVFPWDPEEEAARVLGRFDPEHPWVKEGPSGETACVSGPLRVVALPRRSDFLDLRLTPRQVRARLDELGAERVVAFQTRNPLHRSHEELARRAMEAAGATLLLHPVVGPTRRGDLDYVTRVRTYRAMVSRHFDPARTVLALLPLAMRFAGPREAVWHAIVRRNHGATHFIVGRDHAGPGPGFYEPLEAQEAALAHAAEVGITVVAVKELVYLADEGSYVEEDAVPPGARVERLSGTQVREDFLLRGRPLPAWFTRPEVAAILSEASPARHRQGLCVWFTGLPSSGKTTTAEVLVGLLRERGREVTFLDGDVVRTHLSRGLGFSREDRDANILRIGFVAAEVVRHHGVAVCAAVSPYRAARDEARAMVGPDRFLEVHMATPLEVCEARDARGLYARARAGGLSGFTGVDDPYEPPVRPEVTLDASTLTPEENARRVLDEMARRGFLPAGA
jgi:sulfate adenylyltransferase